MNIERFNVRVYGLLLKDDKVLVTHENRFEMMMTKFPGGGLEKGEGIGECLKREFQEELGIQIIVGELFYVNDFLQLSQFNKSEQLISFYYLVSSKELDNIKVGTAIKSLLPNEQVFEWWKMETLSSDKFTFPIDKVVVEKLSEDV
jgi:8-oxo-dGTP diphosphatase